MKVVQTSVTEAPTAPEFYGLQALVVAPEIEALNAPKIEAINATEVEFSKPEAPAPQVEVYNDLLLLMWFVPVTCMQTLS
uniref:Putative ovule protein n=1 Tax=Solanum chacoense TaxID=4108 RepID=A0A0V0IVE1_SOLCH